jgi:hypothetical protein
VSGSGNVSPPFDQLAQIMADKDEEIQRLRLELLQRKTTNEHDDEKESTPSHERATMASDARRKVRVWAYACAYMCT